MPASIRPPQSSSALSAPAGFTRAPVGEPRLGLETIPRGCFSCLRGTKAAQLAEANGYNELASTPGGFVPSPEKKLQGASAARPITEAVLASSHVT